MPTTANQAVALMRYNAIRCELSRKAKCVCPCRGQLHGQPHPLQWLEEQARVIRAQHAGTGDLWAQA